MTSRALEYDSGSCFLESVMAVVNAREMRRSPSWPVGGLVVSSAIRPPCMPANHQLPGGATTLLRKLADDMHSGQLFQDDRKKDLPLCPSSAVVEIPPKFVANAELRHTEEFTLSRGGFGFTRRVHA